MPETIRRRRGKAGTGKVAELNIQRLPLSRLKPHPRNPRKHPESGTAQWKALKRSLEHDYFDPLVWNKRNKMLVSGHLRRKVLEEMGVVEADVVVVDYDEPTHLARLLAANNPNGEDDLGGLGDILREISELPDFDQMLTAMPSGDIMSFLTSLEGGEGESGEEGAGHSAEGDEQGEIVRDRDYLQAALDSIESPTHEVTTGQVWRLKGRHYLVCAHPCTDHQLYIPYLSGPNEAENPRREGRLLFLAPDPLTFSDYFQDRETIVAVQPDTRLASYTLSLFIAAFGEDAAELIEGAT
jgi:hypothetical protein